MPFLGHHDHHAVAQLRNTQRRPVPGAEAQSGLIRCGKRQFTARRHNPVAADDNGAVVQRGTIHKDIGQQAGGNAGIQRDTALFKLPQSGRAFQNDEGAVLFLLRNLARRLHDLVDGVGQGGMTAAPAGTQVKYGRAELIQRVPYLGLKDHDQHDNAEGRHRGQQPVRGAQIQPTGHHVQHHHGSQPEEQLTRAPDADEGI